MATPKKTPKSKRRASTGGQKSTNTRKVSTKSTTGGKVENGSNTKPVVIGGESPTFTTLKKKTAMLRALKFHYGIIAPACESVGIARSTHYDWIKSDPGYKQEFDAIIEATFDFVESKMVQRINEGSDTMLIWYSKTKMKQRGFVERTEVEVTNTPAFIVEEKQKGAGKIMDIVHKKQKDGTND